MLSSSISAQIVTENAGVISPELPLMRQAVSLFRSENLDEVRWSTQLLFAPDRSREVKLTVPVAWREAHFDAGGVEEEAQAAGLGDISLRFKQALLRSDEVMRSERWSLLLELGAPTGEHDAEEAGVEVPRPLQLGTGDWSLGAGSAYTWIHDRQRVSFEAFYRHRTRHDGVQLGASADLNAAYWYRILPSAFDLADDSPEVRGVVELLGTYYLESEVGSASQDDDGSVVWLAPGLHFYPSTRILLEANIQVPLYQDLEDPLGDRRWAATFVLKLLF
jgi:hypothetical protein